MLAFTVNMGFSVSEFVLLQFKVSADFVPNLQKGAVFFLSTVNVAGEKAEHIKGYHNLSINGYVDCFHLFGLENASLNMGVQSTIPFSFSLYSSHYPSDPPPGRNLQPRKLSSSQRHNLHRLRSGSTLLQRNIARMEHRRHQRVYKRD